ncbi:hypothetical protein K239x_48990 [Planctomycetes bacterium K23_9]|uniref:Sulfatase N-terminal domain-containing protein n=1 Tax=Stieleria marina TaxID=1930275 RepID=A0A517P0I5_9BACT|nr:hypothetical protein K239x_48990 [Planctomycetes bacterium K23_9]
MDVVYEAVQQSFTRCVAIKTPMQTALFFQGYTSGTFCSPTRVGMLIGSYSQHVGAYSASAAYSQQASRRFSAACYRRAFWGPGCDAPFPEIANPCSRAASNRCCAIGRHLFACI